MSNVRTPCVSIVVNGIPLLSVISTEIRSYGQRQAGRFDFEAALNGGMATLAWLEDGSIPVVNIGLSLDGVFFQSILSDQIDHVRIDPIAGTLRGEGRDFAARLIDAPLSENFSNQRSDEIATVLAQRRGLIAKIDLSSGLTGRYYQADHSQMAIGRLARARSEWDLLVEISRREKLDLFVDGSALNLTVPDVSEPVSIFWDAASRSSNVSSLTLTKRPSLASGVQISVRSWHSQDGVSNSASSGSQGGFVADLLRPNLTIDAAQAMADAILADVQSHARGISIRMPGELTMTGRSVIRLDGDVGEWAGLYQIVELVRRIDPVGGFAQTVIARQSPQEF